MNNSKVLILGASGLLGQALVEYFKNNYSLIGAASRSPIKNDNSNIHIHVLDILDKEPVELLIHQYDVIINCTGQITNPINDCLLQNTKGISNIVDAVKKYNKKLIQISSVSVYGSANYVDENSQLNPETPYATMKCFAEYYIQKELDTYIILRISNLYGKNQEKGIINYLVKSYLQNEKKIYFNNDGTLNRYYINIDSVAYIVNKVIELDSSGIYNIMGKDQLTIKELVAKFETILNYKYEVNYTDISPNENINIIDNKKIMNLIVQNDIKSVDEFIGGFIDEKY